MKVLSFLFALLCFAFTVNAGTKEKEEGEKFLAENKEKEGVVTLDSGLQYKAIETGPKDGVSPKVDQKCKCHYEGKLIDGTVFDSSFKRGEPTSFAPNQVIKGWTEAMQIMKPGDKWELYIPSDLAYGSNGAGGLIPGDAVLIFTLQLIEIEKDARAAGEAFLAENKEKEGVKTLDSGLQYKVIKKGDVDALSPLVGTPCECHYEGKLIDGSIFDSSIQRGTPTTFAPNQVIKGWTEAMQLMREGDKWELYIPSDLAYGSRGAGGRIPPHSVLIFSLEIIKVKGEGKKIPSDAGEPEPEPEPEDKDEKDEL